MAKLTIALIDWLTRPKGSKIASRYGQKCDPGRLWMVITLRVLEDGGGENSGKAYNLMSW
jgi:hypothetical protein